jgi:deoxyribose-phosphate aldolase
VRTLRDSEVAVITVTGFPFGADRADHKAHGAARARDDGAAEIDMVVNLGALKSQDWSTFAADIAAVRAAVPDLVLKTILETGLLDAAELDQAARIAIDEGVNYLKTATGYGPRGATVDDVCALVAYGKVKASAGIRTRAQAEQLIDAGASRLGTSAARAILGHEDPS